MQYTIVQQVDKLLLHCVVVVSRRNPGRLPRLAPLGIYSFVERHAHSVHLVDLPVEVRLEVPMRAKRLLDVSRATILRVQLDGLEVCNVVCSPMKIST